MSEARQASFLDFIHSPPVVRISPRELEVLKALMIDGADNPTLARRLGCSYNTVKTHIASLLRKTNTPNRTALALEYLRGQVVIEVEKWDGWRMAVIEVPAHDSITDGDASTHSL